MTLGPFWETLGANFGHFFDFAKKGANHGFIAHGGEIKGAAAEEASREAANMDGKTLKNKAGKTMHLLPILASFWEAFGNILGAKRLSKIE